MERVCMFVISSIGEQTSDLGRRPAVSTVRTAGHPAGNAFTGLEADFLQGFGSHTVAIRNKARRCAHPPTVVTRYRVETDH